MNIGILTSFFPSVIHGIERGAQQEMDGARIFAFAIEHNKQDMLTDILAVLKQQIAEGLDAGGLLKQNVLAGLIGGADPFGGSRKMLQDLESKYGITHDSKGALVLPSP